MDVAVTMSPTIGKIAEAMAKAQMAMRPAVKDATNPHFRNDYATLASCMAALAPFHENGIAIAQIPVTDDNGVLVTTYLLHSSGEWLKGELWMPAQKQDAQGFGSALSYARRYCLCSVTGLATADDDAEAAVQALPPPKTQPKPGPKKARPDPKVEGHADSFDKARNPAAEAARGTLPTGEPVNAEAMMARIGDVRLFPVLHAFAVESAGWPDGAEKAEVTQAIIHRAAALFSTADSMKSVKDGLELFKYLGRPKELAQIGNEAYNRFRGQPEPS